MFTDTSPPMHVRDTLTHSIFESRPLSPVKTLHGRDVEQIVNLFSEGLLFDLDKDGRLQGESSFYESFQVGRGDCIDVSEIGFEDVADEPELAEDALLGYVFRLMEEELGIIGVNQLKLTYYEPLADEFAPSETAAALTHHTDYSTFGRGEDLRVQRGSTNRYIVSIGLRFGGTSLVEAVDPNTPGLGTVSFGGGIRVPRKQIFLADKDLPLGEDGYLDEEAFFDSNPDKFIISPNPRIIIRAPVGWDPSSGHVHRSPGNVLSRIGPDCVHSAPLWSTEFGRSTLLASVPIY